MQWMNDDLPKAKTLEAHLFSSEKNQVHANNKDHAKQQPTVLQFKKWIMYFYIELWKYLCKVKLWKYWKCISNCALLFEYHPHVLPRPKAEWCSMRAQLSSSVQWALSASIWQTSCAVAPDDTRTERLCVGSQKTRTTYEYTYTTRTWSLICQELRRNINASDSPCFNLFKGDL